MSAPIAAKLVGGAKLEVARKAANAGLPVVAILGSSSHAFATIAGPTYAFWNNYTVINWVRWRFNDRMITRPELKFAAGGTDTNDMVTRQLPLLLASDATMALVSGGVNDIGVLPYATTKANLTTFINATRDKGIRLVWPTPWPNTAYNADRLRQMYAFNRLLAKFAADPANLMSLVDLQPGMVDFATSKVIAGQILPDGTHASMAGVTVNELAYSAVLDRILPPPVTVPTYNANDLYNADDAPEGNLISGGLFNGTSGNTVNNATGSLASFWNGGFTGSSASTATLAFSKGTAAGTTNLPTQIVTIGGTADTNSLSMQATNLAGGTGSLVMPAAVVAGTKLEASVRVSWANLVNMKSIFLQLTFDVGGVTYDYQDGSAGTIDSQDPGVLPANRSGMILKAPIVTLLAGFSNVRLRLRGVFGTAGQPVSGVVTFQQAELRIVG
jgi:hypothetical protein